VGGTRSKRERGWGNAKIEGRKSYDGRKKNKDNGASMKEEHNKLNQKKQYLQRHKDQLAGGMKL